MENFMNDEVYAENSEEYEGYFSKNMKYRGKGNDKIHEDMISEYDRNGTDMSNWYK